MPESQTKPPVLMTCTTCKNLKGKSFQAPVDEIGMELMRAHLLKEHGLRL